jgi:hypothetical protein
MMSFLDKQHSVARLGYSRWLVPPAALCIHLSIGQAYACSVFNIPLTRLLGVTRSAEGDWTRENVIWIFSLAASESYAQVLYFMSGLLLIGLVCNLFLAPVDPRHHHAEHSP